MPRTYHLSDEGRMAQARAQRKGVPPGHPRREVLDTSDVKVPAWVPLKPKPLPHGIQERMDAYKAFPSRGAS